MLRSYLKNSINALPLGIPDGTEPVTSHRAREQTGHVGDDEAHGRAAQPANNAPELARRPVAPRVRHPLLAEHLLEDVGELGVLGLLAGLLGVLRVLAVVVALAREEVPGPREAVGHVGTVGVVVVVVGFCFSERVAAGEAAWHLGTAAGGGFFLASSPRGGAEAAEEVALRIVLLSAPGVREGVVCVVDELELAGALGALWGVGWDSVGVGF